MEEMNDTVNSASNDQVMIPNNELTTFDEKLTGRGNRIHELPIKPLLSLSPSRGWIRLNLRDIWEYRELLLFLAWRDIAVRYRQTLLGAAWAVIQPVMTML